MIDLEKGTYGSSQCAHDLVDILNIEDNKKSVKLVSRILNDYFSGVRDIVKTEHITETLLKMWVSKHTDRISAASLNINIKTRVHNLIIAKYRIELKKVKKR